MLTTSSVESKPSCSDSCRVVVVLNETECHLVNEWETSCFVSANWMDAGVYLISFRI